MKLISAQKTQIQQHLDRLQDAADAMEISLKMGNNSIFNGFHGGDFKLQDIFDEVGMNASHPFHCGAILQILLAIMKESDHEKRHSLVGACYGAFLASGISVPDGILYQHGKDLVYNEDGSMQDITQEPPEEPEDEI